LIISKYSSRRI